MAGKTLQQSTQQLYQKIKEFLLQARSKALQAVNTEMVVSYWHIGRLIVEEEQRGEERAEYGEYLIKELSKRLTEEFGKGFSLSNLKYFRQFYLSFSIGHALRDQLPDEKPVKKISDHKSYPHDKGHSTRGQLPVIRPELSWTHYRLLLKVEKAEARSFYMTEAVNARWSTRELERQINSLLFERIALSKDKDGVMGMAKKGHEIQEATDLVKDPYVLEFTGLPQQSRLLERDLESALIDKLQQFLLELGKGFAFMARQQRVTLEGNHFYIDLVFYNRLTRSFVLIDLKVGELKHQDIGQMQMYVNYYQREITDESENPPIGIILCSDKSDAVVRYTLPEDNKQIFASRYKLYLPTEAELAAEIQKERQYIEMEKRLSGDEET